MQFRKFILISCIFNYIIIIGKYSGVKCRLLKQLPLTRRFNENEINKLGAGVNMSKVYIFLADGFEEIEALTVVDLLRRADIDITMVSVSGSLDVMGGHRITVRADKLFEELNFSDADMLVLPGGKMGTDNLSVHEGLDKLLKNFAKQDKLLSAICAAPSILGNKGLLKGKKAICYPGFEEYLTGAKVVDTDVVTDGNIITSKGMGTSIDFSLAIITKLIDENEAAKIAASIRYRHFG